MNKKDKKLTSEQSVKSKHSSAVPFLLAALTGIVYFFSNPRPQSFYDYTFRLADNFLHGRVGLTAQPPSWLNEMIPFENLWFSAFPLGSILTYLPVAALKSLGVVTENPAAFVVAFCGGAICWFLWLIAARYEHDLPRKILLTAGILFGTWMWTNLCFAGAWQLALGFAMLGELGAIYFTAFNRKPFVAGLFFALAFGNRTEILLVAPIFMFLLVRDTNFAKLKSEITNLKLIKDSQSSIRKLILFCAAPFVLGVATLIYNFVRFHSFADFGYAKIPGVLNEPWYQHGIFSLSYIPLNIKEMFFTQWKFLPAFPFLVPTGFGGAIWWSSPFLLYLLRRSARDKVLYRAAWAAIAILTFVLWCHGNPGGWQFSYRYAMILLPFAFLILLENSPRKITPVEWLAYGASVAINAWATYLFFWTDYVKP